MDLKVLAYLVYGSAIAFGDVWDAIAVWGCENAIAFGVWECDRF